MNGEDTRQNERQSLLNRLLDAVKQCQVRFGGRSELATDSDSRVSCLCATWEAVLQHGMKKNNKALSALRHMTERAGLGKMTDFFAEVKNMDTEPAFWQYVREHLTKHEVQRFNTLKQINTDMGRGRAWLRACLNEHSLERYMHMLIEKEDLFHQYYHDWAFMCDQERNSMLPTMSAGLGSILFAITIDRPELNKAYQAAVHVGSSGEVIIPGTTDDEPRAVIAGGDSSPVMKKKEKKKKKKITTNVVSFDDDDGTSETKSGRHSSVTSAASSTSNSAFDDRSTEVFHQQQVSDRNASPSEPPLQNGRTRSQGQGSDSSLSSDRVRAVLQAQNSVASVASASSVFSGTSADVTSNLSKSSLGSVGSFEDVAGTTIARNMMPVGDDSQPISFVADGIHSDASSEMSVFSRGDVDSAVLALAAAQKGYESSRTEGDGRIADAMSEHAQQYMSHEELRQAVVAMMVRKDEVEEQNRSLQALLEQEMDVSSMLRSDIAEMKREHQQQQEQDEAKITKLHSENELLKHQLKKYVNAVQLLRTEGAAGKDDGLGIKVDEAQPSLPPPKPAIDYSHEASEYEQKLIQVAEMHGELMEFNEMLHRTLNAKDHVIRQLREELVSLRGPLPYNDHQLEQNANAAMESLSIQSRTLINIWIPSAFLRGSSSDQYHVFQVYVRIKDQEWNVFRRYSQFLDLHSRLKKVYPIVGKFEFPPKKSVGSKEAKVVESRRQIFQLYLRSVVHVLQEKNPDLCSDTCKAKLVALVPFFGDQPELAGKKGKKQKLSKKQQRAQTLEPQQQQEQEQLPAAPPAAAGGL